MASRSQIESLLAENESKRTALAARLGPAQDEAQRAYDTWKFFSADTGARDGPNWTGTFNGVTYTDRALFVQATLVDFERKRDIRKDLAVQFNALFPEKEQLEKQLALTTDETATVKDTEGTTNPSQSDQKTTNAYADPSKIPDPVQTFDDGSSIQTFDDGSTLVTDSEGKLSSTESTDSSPRPALLSAAGTPISRGAESTKSKGASAQWGGAKDLRVYLRVPGSYLSGQYTSSLQEFAGIMFPYTPEISYDNQASYSAVNPVHTNYTQYFFKNSSVGPITVTGKFTVQNEKEAIIYLSVVHLLRSLTKMRWGSDEAPNAGAPPPVCRFEGYGDFMLRNVPVVLASFKTDFPNTVDYISVNSGAFKTSLVPTISSISLTLNPMYSRKEIQDFSVSGWLSGNLKGKGYL
jgi:hypothetical protein